MRPRWRLIVDGECAGADNMGRDWTLLEAVATGAARPALRLYGWRPPCLSLGRHQRLAAANLGFCRAEGIEVVRRPTGGRAVLHHRELTYAVAAPRGVGPLPRHLQEAYRTICGALVAAARALGVSAELSSGEVNLALPGPRTVAPCFEAPAGAEVVVGGRKLIGSAMRAHASSILQHGSILLDWDGRLQAGAMGLADDAHLRTQVTTFAAELGVVPARERVETAVAEAFRGTLGIELEPVPLDAAELAAATAHAAAFAIS